MKYINVFETEAEYISVKDNLPTPQLALSKDSGKIASQSVVIVPPTPVGPAANEIWYTTTDDNICDVSTFMNNVLQKWKIPENDVKNHIVSNVYNNGKGIITCKETVQYVGINETELSVELYVIFGDITSEGQQYSNLKTIILPDSAIGILSSTFMKCQLTEINISKYITKIDNYSCAYNFLLSTINYTGTKSQWNAITKGEYWHYGCPETTVHCTDGDIIIPSEIEEE